MIRVFDAFSRIGGFRSAFERVGGFKTVGWCEIDRFAQKSYRVLFDTGGEQFYENIWIVNPKLYKNYLAKERVLNSTGVK